MGYAINNMADPTLAWLRKQAPHAEAVVCVNTKKGGYYALTFKTHSIVLPEATKGHFAELMGMNK